MPHGLRGHGRALRDGVRTGVGTAVERDLPAEDELDPQRGQRCGSRRRRRTQHRRRRHLAVGDLDADPPASPIARRAPRAAIAPAPAIADGSAAAACATRARPDQ